MRTLTYSRQYAYDMLSWCCRHWWRL